MALEKEPALQYLFEIENIPAPAKQQSFDSSFEIPAVKTQQKAIGFNLESRRKHLRGQLTKRR